MNIITKKVQISILTTILCLVIFMLNFYPVMAYENSEDAVITEYFEKKEAGLDVYELIDENGEIMGYYEPYSETNPEPIMSRQTSSINWTVSPGLYRYGVNQYSMSNGFKIQVSISQDISGTSYLTFKNRNTGASLRFTNTKTTSGWNGTITLSGISSTIYSFGIENASSLSITYNGTYSL